MKNWPMGENGIKQQKNNNAPVPPIRWSPTAFVYLADDVPV